MTSAAEKTDEQIAKERAAVDAMRNAQKNMGTALDRISSLERALRDAQTAIGFYKGYVPKQAYSYRSETSLHNAMDIKIAEIGKVLGAVS